MSGGEIDCAGAKDQKDVNAVISYALNQSHGLRIQGTQTTQKFTGNHEP